MIKITLKADEVAPSLATVSSVVNPKNYLPILSNVRLEVKKNIEENVYLEMMGSNSEMWLQTKANVIEAEVGDTFCVHAQSFLQAMRGLGNKEIVIEVDNERRILTARYDNGEFSLPTMNAEEYPMPATTLPDTMDVKVENNNLLSALNRVVYAVANDEIRPVMGCVRFDFTEDGMTTVGSDGRTLAKYQDKTIHMNISSPVGFNLPQDASHVLINALSASKTGEVMMSFNDRNAIVCDTNFKLTARLYDGKYPNYNAVIPKNNEKIATVDKAALAMAIKRTMPLGDKSTELLALQFTKDNILLTSKNIDYSTSANENVACTYDAQPIEIGFRGGLIIQALSNMYGNNVKMMLHAPNMAGIITEEEGNEVYDYQVLLMPILLS